MNLTYLGPIDEVEIMATGQTCKRGEQVEVSAEIAGRAPSGDPDDGDDYDPGEGLLAQDTSWVEAGQEDAVAAKKAAAAERRAERKAAKEAAEAAAQDEQTDDDQKGDD